MPKLGKISMSLSVGFLLLPALARGQDATSPSLGDLSRQTRQQKPSDSPSTQTPKPSKVISDEDTPAPAQLSKPGDQRPSEQNSSAARNNQKLTADQWKAQILAQKDLVRSTQTKIERLNQSIHFSASSSSNHVRWNEYQREKQKEVERLQVELERQNKRLEEMQESARQQGYGNTVYDP